MFILIYISLVIIGSRIVRKVFVFERYCICIDIVFVFKNVYLICFFIIWNELV